MGAQKNKHLKILNHKENKYKELAKNMKKFNISQMKIDVIEAKEARYKAWKNEITAMPDY